MIHNIYFLIQYNQNNLLDYDTPNPVLMRIREGL
jgi:hypothetical protein